MSGRRARLARQHARQQQRAGLASALMEGLPETGYGFADVSKDVTRAKAYRCVVNDGAVLPEGITFTAGTVANLPPKGPYQRRWRIYFYCPYEGQMNRRARRANRAYAQAMEAGRKRWIHENRVTDAYKRVMDGEEIPIDDVLLGTETDDRGDL